VTFAPGKIHFDTKMLWMLGVFRV